MARQTDAALNPDAPTSSRGAPRGGAAFADEAVVRLRAAQAALTDLLAGVGLGGVRPTEVGRGLGLDKTLAWKISRFIEDPDPAKAARHMPGAGGIEIVIKAAEASGAIAEHIAQAREADAHLRAFVQKHAGDRRSFEAMLAAGGRDETLEYEERREFYRAGSSVWGVRARVQFLSLAFWPSPTEDGLLDALQVSGLIDFERLRPDVPWIFRRVRASSDGGAKRFTVRREALDPEGARGGGAGLMTRYCSSPLPEISQFVGENGWIYDELAPGAVGRRGALTCVAGERYRGVLPFKHSPDNTEGRYLLTVRTPVEVVVFDLFIHESLRHFGDAESSVHGLVEDRPSRGANRGLTLSPRSPAHKLGNPPVVQTPRLGSYTSLVNDAFGLAGGPGLEEFRGYRTELEYPPAPCELVMTCAISPEG